MVDNASQEAVLNGYVTTNESKPQNVILKGCVSIDNDRPQAMVLKGYVAINDDSSHVTSLQGTITVPEVVQISGISDTIILVDDHGNEITAVLSNESVNLDATPNDIRIGKRAATNDGVTLGEKEIPAYYVTEGSRIITVGSEFKFRTQYDGYAKLQAMLCKFNSTIPLSVTTEKVSINGKVYDVNSDKEISTVTFNATDSCVYIGVTNNSTSTYVLRFFMYKEIY